MASLEPVAAALLHCAGAQGAARRPFDFQLRQPLASEGSPPARRFIIWSLFGGFLIPVQPNHRWGHDRVLSGSLRVKLQLVPKFEGSARRTTCGRRYLVI